MIIGNCKLDDNKLEKNGNYEVIMDKDCPYFTCDNPKGSVNSGQEITITFGYKKPDRDPLIKDIECLKGVGMWVESTNEIKINGGYIEGNTQDNVSVFVIFHLPRGCRNPRGYHCLLPHQGYAAVMRTPFNRKMVGACCQALFRKERAQHLGQGDIQDCPVEQASLVHSLRQRLRLHGSLWLSRLGSEDID